ncbi:hypothetical protein GOP47_0023132 [Adiantum capillus-veneris]|uniref:Uncharacterized protein n=1 Tax=Adiantum capillus-veneris TaxID=13818 RepID=A0A9D4U6X3_ADICA|nr:hypothetical protein GOP47_0023132 [Adiantum capillus-veneris]
MVPRNTITTNADGIPDAYMEGGISNTNTLQHLGRAAAELTFLMAVLVLDSFGSFMSALTLWACWTILLVKLLTDFSVRPGWKWLTSYMHIRGRSNLQHRLRSDESTSPSAAGLDDQQLNLIITGADRVRGDVSAQCIKFTLATVLAGNAYIFGLTLSPGCSTPPCSERAMESIMGLAVLVMVLEGTPLLLSDGLFRGSVVKRMERSWILFGHAIALFRRDPELTWLQLVFILQNFQASASSAVLVTTGGLLVGGNFGSFMTRRCFWLCWSIIVIELLAEGACPIAVTHFRCWRSMQLQHTSDNSNIGAAPSHIIDEPSSLQQTNSNDNSNIDAAPHHIIDEPSSLQQANSNDDNVSPPPHHVDELNGLNHSSTNDSNCTTALPPRDEPISSIQHVNTNDNDITAAPGPQHELLSATLIDQVSPNISIQLENINIQHPGLSAMKQGNRQLMEEAIAKLLLRVPTQAVVCGFLIKVVASQAYYPADLDPNVCDAICKQNTRALLMVMCIFTGSQVLSICPLWTAFQILAALLQTFLAYGPGFILISIGPTVLLFLRTIKVVNESRLMVMWALILLAFNVFFCSMYWFLLVTGDVKPYAFMFPLWLSLVLLAIIVAVTDRILGFV